MVTHHVIYDQPGVYIPKLCPHVVLWRRHKGDDAPPIDGSVIVNAQAARKFGDVTVIVNGKVKEQLPQEGIDDGN